MLKSTIKPQELVSTLWIFILFNMLLRDLHEFPTEGYIEELMSLKLSEEVMLFYAFIVEIPISMIILSRILNHKANKWANVIAVLISSIGILYTLPSGDLDEIFFALINTVAFIVILKTAWNFPSLKSTKI
jgi:hypothetical protein